MGRVTWNRIADVERSWRTGGPAMRVTGISVAGEAVGVNIPGSSGASASIWSS